MPTIIGGVNTTLNDDLQWLWPYVYICTGIAGLVFIVMAVTLLIIRCQGEWFVKDLYIYNNLFH